MSLMIEDKYISETPISYRKSLGQFFTPSSVARIMVNWLVRNNPQTILDPAFGLGVFYNEVVKIRGDNNYSFIGYEIDDRILSYYNNGSTKPNLIIKNEDYLEADIKLYDSIICNPPYMRFQNFLNRHNILPKIEEKIGKRLVGYSNIASVFLVKSLIELNEDGRLAYIMPFEFFNTGYGHEIKKILLEEHYLKQIIIFENEKDVFPDVITTVCILLCKKDYKKDPIKITKITTDVDINTIVDIEDFYQREIDPSDLPHNKKWTPIISSLFSSQSVPDGFCALSTFGIFKRGIATGANEFFSLTKTKIARLNLDGNVCRCITRSSLITKPVFTNDDFDILSDRDKPVYCLDVKNDFDLFVHNYLIFGEQQGYHNRYLTKNRNPWYRIETRIPSPILFGVFHRGRLKVIRNYSDAINFTCYHSFYPNNQGKKVIDKLFVYLLSDKGQNVIKMNKRSYGDNLDKLEPGDLNECLSPNQEQFKLISELEAEEVIKIANTNTQKSIEMSNQLMSRIIDE